MSELALSARSNEGLRTCLRIGVAGDWRTASASAAAEAIGAALMDRFAGVPVHARPAVVLRADEVVGQLWIHVHRHAATIAAADSPWAVVVTQCKQFASQEVTDQLPSMDDDTLTFLAATHASMPAPAAAPLFVDFDESSALSRIVDGLIEAGASPLWARTAVAGVAAVAYERGRTLRHREARRAARNGHLAATGVSPLWPVS